ncbi:MAG: sugar ABC transporter permease [Chloroflexota bacterium]|nr:sugar ABC transporter permease [Chloroflexota bacterium]
MPILPRQNPSQGQLNEGKTSSSRSSWRAAPYLFILPYMLFFVIFRLGPSLAGLGIAFTNWAAVGTPKWVGLGNFEAMVRDPLLKDAVLNTILFTALTVPLLIGLGLGLALFMNQPYRGRELGRVAVFTPFVVMSTVVGVLWTWLLEKDFGLINVTFGLDIPWLVSKDYAMLAIVMTTVWWTVGYNMVLFLAGLQDIPRELYEAARIDGAGRFQLLRRITLPLLAPTMFLVLMLTIINTFQVFDQVFVMTSGGPGTSTLTLVQYVYTTAFQFRKFGYGSAVAVLLFAILVLLALIQTRAYRRGLEGVTE